MKLTKEEQRALRSAAQTIKPKVFVGKNGINVGTINSIDEVLTADELVKVKFLNYAEEIDQHTANIITETLNAEFVQRIGRVLVFYRKNEEK